MVTCSGRGEQGEEWGPAGEGGTGHCRDLRGDTERPPAAEGRVSPARPMPPVVEKVTTVYRAVGQTPFPAGAPWSSGWARSRLRPFPREAAGLETGPRPALPWPPSPAPQCDSRALGLATTDQLLRGKPLLWRLEKLRSREASASRRWSGVLGSGRSSPGRVRPAPGAVLETLPRSAPRP